MVYITHESAIVQNIQTENTFDNGNMIYFRMEYNFKFGKQSKEDRKQLRNEDNDQGIFMNK